MKSTLMFSLLHYGIAVPAIALAVLLTALLPPLEQAPSTLFFAAVMVSAWCGGLGPGLLATGLSVVTIDYFFVHPAYSLGVGLVDAVRLGMFGLVSLLISSLNEARKRLEVSLREQNRHKEVFLAVLAHELRTPLSTILTAAATLRLQNPERAQVEQIRQMIERQVGTMSRLINDVLDVCRARLGKLRLEKKLIDLGAIVTQAVESARPLIDARRHWLEMSMPPAHVWVQADPVRLEQVVINLLGNAAKYTPPGGRIWLLVQETNGSAVLRVRDSGIGLSPEVLPRVFDLFAQAENGSQEGLGIGLSLARDLVELQGGSIAARSEGAGRGSEFTVCLPLPGRPS